MRKWFVFILLVGVLLLPSLAHAQSPVSIDKVLVQLLPEYDQPSMLVIYDFSLASTTTLPAQLAFRIPADATLHAVAKDEGGALINVPYDAPVSQGEWTTVSFSVTDLSTYHIEYYAPLTMQETERHYTYKWPGDYAVGQFTLKLQEPSGARDLITDPVLTDVVTGADNLAYRGTTLADVPAGEPLLMTVKYQKDSDSLTVSSMQVQPSGSLNESKAIPFSFADALPWILGTLGVVLIAGGIIYFWRSGRTQTSGFRKRHASRSHDSEDKSSSIYCTQCGKRAQPGDRFCRACGTRVR